MKLYRVSLLSGLIGVLVTVFQPVQAQDSVVACTSIENADERLACYDRAAESARNMPVVRLPRTERPESRPAESSDRAASAAAAVRQDDFGLEQKEERKPDNSPVASRDYRVLSASHNDFTGWTIEFEGGGTWKQVGTEDYDIKIGETYTIRRASFSSYVLSNAKNNKKIRVTRIE